MKTPFHFRAIRRIPRGKAWFAVAAVALAVAGVAIADPGSGSTNTVSATFIATTSVDKNVQTCTGTDGTYEITHATYTGSATSSDVNLNGAIKLDVKAVYNQTKNLGWVEANVHVDGSTAGHGAHGHLTAVNSNGTLEGFLNGDEQGPDGKLLANVTGAFTSLGGFTSGSIGTGGGNNTALVAGGDCKPPKPPKPDHPKPDHPKPDKHHH